MDSKSNGLENYKTNPIVLFNHDYNKPIGRATSIGSYRQMVWNLERKSLNLQAK